MRQNRPRTPPSDIMKGSDMAAISPQEMKELVGKPLGTSEWVLVDQAMIDKFADATGDHQFIHIDPDKAKLTPFGGTIAHGFLTLSLFPMLIAKSDCPRPADVKIGRASCRERVCQYV